MTNSETPQGEQGDSLKQPVRFFDSHGGLWETCHANDDGAEAFGPAGTARKIDPKQAGLEMHGNETAWGVAQRLGRIKRGEEDTDWDILSE